MPSPVASKLTGPPPSGKSSSSPSPALFLVLFLAGHLVGNLVVFMGPEPFNAYAYFLHHMLHGVGIWVFRIVMLVMLGAHIIATVALTRQNRAARKAYEHPATIQASKSSRYDDPLRPDHPGLLHLSHAAFHRAHRQ